MHFDDPAPLPDRLTTALERIALAVRSQSWQRARARGLTPTQAQVLVLLGGEKQGRRLGTVAAAHEHHAGDRQRRGPLPRGEGSGRGASARATTPGPCA